MPNPVDLPTIDVGLLYGSGLGGDGNTMIDWSSPAHAFGAFGASAFEPAGHPAEAIQHAYLRAMPDDWSQGSANNGDLTNLGFPIITTIVGIAEGSFEAAIGLGFGAVTSWTGIGAVAGGAIALHGLDVAQAALRRTDTFTSEGLQAAGLSQNTANAIDTGITGIAFIAAGSPILPYSLVASVRPLSGGGIGTSLLSAAARGNVPPIGRILSGNVSASSGPVWSALSNYYNTAHEAAIVGRVASDASVFLGGGIAEYAVYEGVTGNDW